MNKDLSFKYLYTALADELLAAYQYWTAKNSSRGDGKSDVDPEFEAHSYEEMDHANEVMERIKQLGGEPYPNPKDWEGAANPWQPITTRDIKSQLEITMKAEAAAIDFYERAVEDLKDEDPTSHKLFRSLLKDEEEHLYDLKELYCELTGKSFEEVDAFIATESEDSSSEIDVEEEDDDDKDIDVEEDDEDANEEEDINEEDVEDESEMDDEDIDVEDDDEKDGEEIHAFIEDEDSVEEEDKKEIPETFDAWAPYIEKRIEDALTAKEDLENMVDDSQDTLSNILNDLYDWEDNHPEEAKNNSEWFSDLESRLESMLDGFEDVEDFFEDLSFGDVDEDEEDYEELEDEDLEKEGKEEI